MLISPKYCKVKNYDHDDDEDNDDDDGHDDEDNMMMMRRRMMLMRMISISAIMISTVNNDEDLGIHVVGQRLGLGTPSTQPSSPSSSPSPLDLTNIFVIIVIPNT